jgi:hypothetical protein
MSDISKLFIENARSLLTTNYRPKIERCLAELTDEQTWSRPNDASNSIGNLILHLCGNARQYIVSGVGQTEDTRKRKTEFEARGGMTKDELKGKLLQTLTEVDKVLDGLTESQLSEWRRIQGRSIPVLEAVFKVVEHFSMHAGQIIMLTKMLANKDLRFYVFPDGPDGMSQANWK